MLTRQQALDKWIYDPDTGQFYDHKSGKAVGGRQQAGSIGKKRTRAETYIALNYMQNNKRKQYKAHRIAFLIMTGSIPEKVDHINHIGTDNRWSNLASSNSTMNGKNMSKKPKNGIFGICKWNGKWKAQIGHENKMLHLGYYEDYFEACCARKSAEIKYKFHPNHGLAITA